MRVELKERKIFKNHFGQFHKLNNDNSQFILLAMVFKLSTISFLLYDTKYDRMGGTLGVAAGLDSVAFFSKTKPKEEKVFFFIPPDLVLHSRYKNKRSLRSDVDRSNDRQTRRLL